MRTTVEIPDPVVRRAKAMAAARGIPFSKFVTEAVKDKLEHEARTSERPWLKLAGRLKHLQEETLRIDRLIEEEAEKIDSRT